jgi:hypothetical protein
MTRDLLFNENFYIKRFVMLELKNFFRNNSINALVYKSQ